MRALGTLMKQHELAIPSMQQIGGAASIELRSITVINTTFLKYYFLKYP